MNTGEKTLTTAAKVTKAYNDKQEATGMAMLRIWVPTELLPVIRRNLEREKLDYLLAMIEDGGDADARVVALSTRNVATPLTNKEMAAIRDFIDAEDDDEYKQLVAAALAEYADKAAACERAVLKARLAAREGNEADAIVNLAQAVAYGYMLRFLKTDLLDLVTT